MLVLALNIWLIVLDDADVSLLFNPARHTPNLDRIFASAVVFPNVYSEGAVCRPALAALDLGMSPRKTTIYANPTPRVETTKNAIAERLRQIGYTTFRGGKFWPSNWGGTPDDYGYTLTERTGNGTSQEQSGFVRAGNQEGFLDAIAVEPFFAFWSPMLPHTPFNAPAEYEALIDTQLIPPPPEWVTSPADVTTYYTQTRDYLANLAWCDAAIGTGIEALESSGAWKNTVVFVVADNGWSYGHVGKRSPFDRGMRVTMGVAWESVLLPGLRDDLHYLADVPDTIADFANLPLSGDDADASAMPSCFGIGAGRPYLVGGSWSHLPYPGETEEALVAEWVRTPTHKYVRFLRDVTPGHESVLRWVHNCVPFPTYYAGDELLSLSTDRDERTPIIDPVALAECRAIADGW